LGASIAGVDFDACMSVDQELSKCGVVGSWNFVEERQGDGGDADETESKPVSSFTEALHAFESIRMFMYAHNITKRDEVNIINIERFEKERCS
jgi:hypothetical protein